MKYKILPVLKKFSYLFLSLAFINNIEAQDITFETQYLQLSINKKGNITGLSDKQSGKNYFPAAQKSALLTLFKDSTYIEPVSASFNKKQNTITLQYTNGCVANIGITNGGAYLKFVLQSLQPRNDIQAVVWGPYSTTIQESIGERIALYMMNSLLWG
ncbi:MAG: hypothetical protein QM802_20210 [Agriterribacter sp.]